MGTSVKAVIDEVVDIIKTSIDLLEENQAEKSDENFSLPGFWFRIDHSVQIISNEVTNISLQFSKPPYPNATDLSAMLKHLMINHSHLVNVYHTLTKQQGIMFKKEVTLAVNKILVALLHFIRSLKDLTNKGNKDRLSYTGTLWDACTAISEVPKDNLQAILIYLKQQKALVCDALQEIEEEIKQDQATLVSTGDDVNHLEVWTNPERDLASSCLGIIKTARSCLKRVYDSVHSNGSCKDLKSICELDELYDLVKVVSPAVDDFIQEIYPPMNTNNVRTKGADIALAVCNILNQIEGRHYITGDISWIDFLRKAVAHNNNKLQPLASSTDPVLLLNSLNIST